MRRVLAVSLVLPVAGALAVAPSHGASAADATESRPLAAVEADSLVDSYGVGVHLGFLDTPYRDADAVADALTDLGVRHVRDDLHMGAPWQYDAIRTVADRGIGFTLITGSPASPDSPAAYVDTIATQLPPGSVEAVEGTNEWDLFSRGSETWAAELTARQRDLYQATKANPATAHLPVLAPALAFRWNYAQLGDLTPYADYANAHMYAGGHRPSNEMSRVTDAVRGAVAPDKPLVTTEAGYHNATSTTQQHLPVPEHVAGVYAPRLLLEHHLNGDRRVYTYELIDAFADPERTNPEAHFGLLRHDLSPKPAYRAMRNLLALLDDPGPSFTPRPLAVTATGWPSDGRYVLAQKRSGQHVLLLWRDVSVYDPVARQDQAVTPMKVTLQLARRATIELYRPSQRRASLRRVVGASVGIALDGSVTAVTIDRPPAPRPRKVRSTAGTRGRAWVRWSMPSTNAKVTGFMVTRRPGGRAVVLPRAARAYQAKGLRKGTRYVFKVSALSPDGNSPAVAAPAVTLRRPQGRR